MLIDVNKWIDKNGSFDEAGGLDLVRHGYEWIRRMRKFENKADRHTFQKVFGNKRGNELWDCFLEVGRSIFILEDSYFLINDRNVFSLCLAECSDYDLYELVQCLIWDGIQFYGWLWDGSRPIKRSTRESLNACEIYRDKIAFIDYHGNKYDAEYFQRFTQTAEQCRSANKPRIVMLDEEEPPYSVNPTYIRNLQEMSAEAVERLTELKCYSREEAFDIIQDWAKEFTKRYNNYVFDGSYYKMIDTFIEEKLRTI